MFFPDERLHYLSKIRTVYPNSGILEWLVRKSKHQAKANDHENHVRDV